jgi:curved DNA-binding protein CbpA
VGEGSSAMERKGAYRRMVSAWHPDRMGQREERVRTLATEQMVAINAAYDFLRGREVGTAGIA